MNSQDVQTVNGKLDAVLVTLAAVVALGGVLGFSLLSEQSLLARLGILAGGLVAGLVIAWFSLPGKRFIGFSRESYDETRRVVWPSRKETLQTTGIVFAFVAIMAIFLFLPVFVLGRFRWWRWWRRLLFLFWGWGGIAPSGSFRYSGIALSALANLKSLQSSASGRIKKDKSYLPYMT